MTHAVSHPPKVIGMYITDTNTLSLTGNAKGYWKAKDAGRYLPLLNLFTFHGNADIKFTTGENVSDDIVTYNENATARRLSDSVQKRTRLNATQNDLLIDPVQLALNFTRYNLTIASGANTPKMFRPLTNDSFREYEGKLVILKVSTLTSPVTFNSIYGVANYMETLLEKNRNKTGPGYLSQDVFLRSVMSFWSSLSDIPQASLQDTLKVCQIREIPESEFVEHGVFRTLRLTGTNLTISGLSIVEIADNPALTQLGESEGVVLDTVRTHGVSCYIVDPDDQLGPRYYSFAGHVREVPKEKHPDMTPGLYIVSTDKNARLTPENFTPLENIDDNRYIYKSREEAEHGADLKTRYSNDFDMERLANNAEAESLRIEAARIKHAADTVKLTAESEAAKIKVQYEGQLLQIKTENERALTEQKKRYEEEMALLRTQQKKDDLHFDRIKFSFDERGMMRRDTYESERYHRDSTIETLKTAGSIAGLLAAGFIAYRKFS